MKVQLLGLLGTISTLLFFFGLSNPSQARPVITSSHPEILISERKTSKLNLTPEQQTQMRQIWQSTRTQIENVLTEEQKNQLRTAKDKGQNMRQVWSSLNLTSEQQSQIQAIRQDSQQKMKAILTPEQQQQLEQMRQNRRQS
ncbi:Spy/CpxP family protein refolding chaperone [Gloeothece verrucosa]|uniref:P pilus assembly/Cpx signaling pathway, periplasmic inhibitor/zinc-resistance associated protein n=1 Tax=Gloeothece verrucosa (strain PCC 7822) TaxID=497965 RepID=E0UK74_GLOV7|nr:hypothetical protein [Gloeothece verrucosa]ADN15836.1 hypothetical protein Cyan7822_3905 [Gloeothece verrucosa PCC 7822]